MYKMTIGDLGTVLLLNMNNGTFIDTCPEKVMFWVVSDRYSTRLEKEAVILFPTLSNLPGLSLGWKAHFPPGVGDKQASQKARQRVRSSQPHNTDSSLFLQF